MEQRRFWVAPCQVIRLLVPRVNCLVLRPGYSCQEAAKYVPTMISEREINRAVFWSFVEIRPKAVKIFLNLVLAFINTKFWFFSSIGSDKLCPAADRLGRSLAIKRAARPPQIVSNYLKASQKSATGLLQRVAWCSLSQKAVLKKPNVCGPSN